MKNGESRFWDDTASLVERHHPVADLGSLDPAMAAAERLIAEQGRIDFEALDRAAPGMLVHVISTEAHDPLGYRVDRYDQRATLDSGANHTGLVVGDYPVPLYAERIAAAYATTVVFARPTLISTSWRRKGGETRRFLRLTLPLKEGNQTRKVVNLVRSEKGNLLTHLVGQNKAWRGQKMESVSLAARGIDLRLEGGVHFGISVNAQREALLDGLADGVTDQGLEALAPPFQDGRSH